MRYLSIHEHMRHIRHAEEDMQIACVTWFTYTHQKLAPLLHHSPNGGRRDSREAARFKAMGVRPGFPDLFLYVARHGYHGLAIELKYGRNKQTPQQVEMQALLESQGFKYLVCYSYDEFTEAVNEYLTEG